MTCRGEFAKAMHSLGLRLTGAQLDLLFKEYDTDGSGQIDLTEFTNMVNKCIKKSANKKMREEVVAKFQSRWVSSGATMEENMIKWDSSASTMQKWVRGRSALEYLNKLRRYLPSRFLFRVVASALKRLMMIANSWLKSSERAEYLLSKNKGVDFLVLQVDNDYSKGHERLAGPQICQAYAWRRSGCFLLHAAPIHGAQAHGP